MRAEKLAVFEFRTSKELILIGRRGGKFTHYHKKDTESMLARARNSNEEHRKIVEIVQGILLLTNLICCAFHRLRTFKEALCILSKRKWRTQVNRHRFKAYDRYYYLRYHLRLRPLEYIFSPRGYTDRLN